MAWLLNYYSLTASVADWLAPKPTDLCSHYRTRENTTLNVFTGVDICPKERLCGVAQRSFVASVGDYYYYEKGFANTGNESSGYVVEWSTS